MGPSSLRPFLQSICCNSPWNYAVLWKPKYQYERNLIWEDGFYDLLKPRNPVVGPIEGFYLENSDEMPLNFGSSMFDGTASEYQVGFAVAGMSNASHIVGKGVVGKAALAGNACWIYSDSLATDDYDSASVPEYPDEWQRQFAAGIKTILLVPIIPHGVLQLGSAEMVAEDAALVAYVREKFEAHERSGHYQGFSVEQFIFASNFNENLEKPLTINTENTTEDQKTTGHNLFDNLMVPTYTVQESYKSSMRKCTDISENVVDNEFDWQSPGMFHAVDPWQLSSEGKDCMIADNSIMSDDTILKSFHLDENITSFNSDNFHWTMYGDCINELIDPHYEEGAIQQIYGGDNFDNSIYENENNFFGFSWDSELHNSLEPTIAGDIYHHTYDSSNLHRSIHDKNTWYNEDLLREESTGRPIREGHVNHLLEAVVASACGSPCANSSDRSNISSVDTLTRDDLVSSNKISQASASVVEDTLPSNLFTSESISQQRNTVSIMAATASSKESKMTALVNSRKRRREGYHLQNPQRVSRLSTTNKRKVRTGNSQNSRPRDRQLIQDRIKELRTLIPKSESCSIDGLLNKTIKHLHFLRGVTSQADKLVLQGLKEATDKKITETTEVNRDHRNGKSWAVELNGEKPLCPIVVKDLDPPGHLLIEMLCTDHDRFLEIADVIHRLQLTILKGVMEGKSGNSRARFVVQASGSFQRLDIFWPLMQLL